MSRRPHHSSERVPTISKPTGRSQNFKRFDRDFVVLRINEDLARFCVKRLMHMTSYQDIEAVNGHRKVLKPIHRATSKNAASRTMSYQHHISGSLYAIGLSAVFPFADTKLNLNECGVFTIQRLKIKL